jgi:glycosyltransferase involved in cell wall biosynthesis
VRLSVVVPVRNKAPVLTQALGSIVEAVRLHPSSELVVLDHGSTDGSDRILREIVDEKQILSLRGGTIAFARNTGARRASGDVIVFLDCDVEVPADFMSRVEHTLATTGAEVTGAPVALPTNPTWVERAWHQLTVDERSGPRHFLNSGNITIRRAAFDRVGGFPEELETGEDWEICRRLSASGSVIHADSSLVARHLDNPKTLSAFYRKERWYGLGMLHASAKGTLNRTTIMTLAFVACATVAVAGWLTGSVTTGTIGLGLLFVVLVLTYLYRRRSAGRWGPILASPLLLVVFYLARTDGLVRSLMRGPSAPPA